MLLSLVCDWDPSTADTRPKTIAVDNLLTPAVGYISVKSTATASTAGGHRSAGLSRSLDLTRAFANLLFMATEQK
jgi:hypothetical protein